jgi:hypothetical protein
MSRDTTDILNRLLVIHNRSLPSYLAYVAPRSTNQGGRTIVELANIADEQQNIANRLATAVRDIGGQPIPGNFPMAFVTLHDLSPGFLLSEAVRYQRRTIEMIQKAVPLLPDASLAQTLAEDALSAARNHLEAMEELAAANSL